MEVIDLKGLLIKACEASHQGQEEDVQYFVLYLSKLPINVNHYFYIPNDYP